MIGYISGTIIDTTIGGKDITVLTTGGVGYRLFVSQSEGYLPGQETSLFVTTIVRDDALDLYGFTSSDERELFEILTSASGVGPRTALGILSATTPASLAGAIAARDVTFLTTLSGIGKKTAEKMCIELAEKMKRLSFETSTNTAHNDLADALVSMGYQSRDIISLMQDFKFAETSLQGRIREALSELQKRKK